MSTHHDRVSAPPILSNDPDSFAWGVLHHRHPALIGQVAAAHPYPPRVRRALDELRQRLGEPITALPADASPAAWDRWFTGHVGQVWADAPFLWAESYFYRLLLDAVGYFAPGPWQGIDPFAPQKAAELDDIVRTGLPALDDLADLAPREQAHQVLSAALWGNRADLGFRLSDPDSAARDHHEDLVADHSRQILDHLDAHPTGTVCVVADNAGRELLADLMLIDHLLAADPRRTVDLHLKPAPYYVSDATTADLLATLRLLTSLPDSQTVHSGRRLWSALAEGRLGITSHPFYCAPLPFADMPDDLAAMFAAAELTIVKGDLNYRRLVGDHLWAPTTGFGELTGYFPGPVAALRTLKSDVVVGLHPGTVASLDGSAPRWRVSGTHAMIQTNLDTLAGGERSAVVRR